MQLLKYCGILLICLFSAGHLQAQSDFHNYNSRYVGEFGVEAGVAHYFGDLNTGSSFRSPKMTGGVFYRYFFNNYIGLSGHVRFAQLGYSDIYNRDSFQHTRNLSFNSDVWDFSLQGDFNFFRFEPGSLSYRFTPYITFGIGALHFNPYAYDEGRKYYLQPLGTEGQYSPLYPDRKPYQLWTYEIPVGIGLKYNLNSTWNVALSVIYHYTGTDYLDDVSSSYAGPSAFPPGTGGKENIAAKLQDRSGYYGTPIGIAGRQRGISTNKDQFIGISLSIAYLFSNYRCPVF